MSEQTINIGYKVYKQAYKAGQVIRIQLTGYTGYSYFRIIGFADSKPWVKLMYIGYIGDAGGLPTVPTGSSPAYRNCEKQHIYFTNPATGQSDDAYAVYYYSDNTGFTGPDTSLEGRWYSNLPSEIKAYIPSIFLGAQNIYSNATQTLASGFSPDITINPTSTTPGTKWYLNKISSLNSLGISRHVFVPSVEDIINVLGTNTPTSTDIANNFLGCKHYGGNGTTQIKGEFGTALFDATLEQSSSTSEGYASDVGYNTETGGYINRWLGENRLMPTFYLNLRSFRKWELATDW